MKLLLAGLLFVAFLGRAVAAQTGPASFDFEQDQPGQPPTGWTFNAPQQPGARAQVTSDDRKSGARALVIARDPSSPTPNPAILLQSFEATPYRGKRIRFRFATRVEAPATAQLWLRVDLPPVNGRPGSAFFDNMDDRPIRSREWTYHEIVGDIDDNAARVFLGAMAFGMGRVWLDDGSIEVVGEAERRVAEGPRPLTDRGLVNLTALTRLLGYVRHFHPSDEAARANWNAIAVAGVRAVEGSANAASLAERLAALVAPVAPSVEVFETGKARRLPALDVGGQKLLAWRHVGYPQGTGPNIYRSERVVVPSASDAFQADLGGGVMARIPLAVRADDAGTFPRVPPLPAPTVPQATRDVLSATDRAVRLAGVALIWNVLEHFYPYFDVVQTDWASALARALREAATSADERGYVDALRRLAAALHDGHGRVTSSVDLPQTPAVAWEWIENSLVVTAAEESTTLARGDVVTAVDGIPVDRLLRDREALISGATPQWIRYRAVQELAAGPPNTPVALDVERFRSRGSTQRVVVVRRATPQPFSEARPDPVTEIEPGIYYVDLDRVTDAALASAFPKLETARGVVFDMRGYPRLTDPLKLFGRLSAAPMSSAQWHVPIITVPGAAPTFQRQGEWLIPPQTPLLSARKAFITDGRAISYAESLMGIVEHYRLGEIVGGPTAGTNGNITVATAPGNLGVVFTGMRVLKHDGLRHHGVGIQPTIPASRTRAGVAAGRDELLERALQVVR